MASTSVVTVDVSRIRPFHLNPRRHFDSEKLARLGASLLKKQRLPIVVVEVSDDPRFDYEITDGERRWRAAKLVKKPDLNAIVEDRAAAALRFRDSFVSNCCREELSVLEQAEAVWKLVDSGMTSQEIAEETGYSLSWVTQRLTLRTLEPTVLALMAPDRPDDKRMGLTHAVNLAALPRDLQLEVAEQVIEKRIRTGGVRSLVIARNHKAGHGLGARHVPHKHFERITGMINRLRDESANVISMPPAVFVDTFKDRQSAEMIRLLGTIDEVALNLKTLRGCIELATKGKKKG